MMREQDHNRKSELLLQAIGELPDEMIAQAAPQNLPLTKHRGAKLLRPQMFPAAAMVGIGVGLCLLAHHYTSQNNGDPNATNSSEYAYTNTSPNQTIIMLRGRYKRDGGQFEFHSKSCFLSRSAGDRLRKRKRRQQGIRLL